MKRLGESTWKFVRLSACGRWSWLTITQILCVVKVTLTSECFELDYPPKAGLLLSCCMIKWFVSGMFSATLQLLTITCPLRFIMVPANYPISIAYSVYHLSLTHLLTRRWQTHQTSILGSFNIDLRPRIYQNGGPHNQRPFQEPIDWRYLCKAYVRGYTPRIWPDMVQYLHFRILEWPLTKSSMLFITGQLMVSAPRFWETPHALIWFLQLWPFISYKY